MKRGRTKSDLVNYALTETFGNPDPYSEEYSKHMKIGKPTIANKKDTCKILKQNCMIMNDISVISTL